MSNQSFDVLIRLARTEGIELRMSELAAQTSLTPSGLTRSVDRLADQGLVARRVCPEDRRGAFAVLTPSGQELMDRAIPDHLAHIDELLSDLFDRRGGEGPGAAPPQASRPSLRHQRTSGGSPTRTPTSARGPTERSVDRSGRVRTVRLSASDRAAARTGCRRGCPPATRPARLRPSDRSTANG